MNTELYEQTQPQEDSIETAGPYITDYFEWDISNPEQFPNTFKLHGDYRGMSFDEVRELLHRIYKVEESIDSWDFFSKQIIDESNGSTLKKGVTPGETWYEERDDQGFVQWAMKQVGDTYDLYINDWVDLNESDKEGDVNKENVMMHFKSWDRGETYQLFVITIEEHAGAVTTASTVRLYSDKFEGTSKVPDFKELEENDIRVDYEIETWETGEYNHYWNGSLSLADVIQGSDSNAPLLLKPRYTKGMPSNLYMQ
jgi:hypothetical protein